MIQFFRKIRRVLLNDRKFIRYFFYALGEILLIIAGILIALKINDVNEVRKLKETETALLQEMKSNLEADLIDCRVNIQENQMRLESNTTIHRFLIDQTSFHDSLRPYYSNIFGSTELTENTAAYDNFESIGFHIIENDSLRFKITELYSNRYRYLSSIEANAYQFQVVQVLPLIVKHIEHNPIFVSAEPVNQKDLFFNHEFLETLKLNMVWRNQLIDLYRDTEEKILELVDLINLELAH